jgi:hypothetical protein
MDKRVCLHCGKEIPEEGRFCPQCGAPAPPPQDSHLPYSRERNFSFTLEEIASFVQKEVSRYTEKFLKFETEGFSLSWNWGAFFFGGFWFLYRKVYLAGFLFLLLSTFIPFLWLIPPLVGDYLYYLHFRKKLSHLKKLYSDPPLLHGTLLREGGTTLSIPLITFFFYGIFLVLLAIVTFLYQLLPL